MNLRATPPLRPAPHRCVNGAFKMLAMHKGWPALTWQPGGANKDVPCPVAGKVK